MTLSHSDAQETKSGVDSEQFRRVMIQLKLTIFVFGINKYQCYIYLMKILIHDFVLLFLLCSTRSAATP